MYGKLPLHQHSSSVTPPTRFLVVPRQMNSIYLYLEMEIKNAGEDKESVRGREAIKAAFQHEPLVWMPDKASVNRGPHRISFKFYPVCTAVLQATRMSTCAAHHLAPCEQ